MFSPELSAIETEATACFGPYFLVLLLYRNPLFCFNISNFLRNQINGKTPSYALKIECVHMCIQMYFIVFLLLDICYIINSSTVNIDGHACSHIALIFRSVNLF